MARSNIEFHDKAVSVGSLIMNDSGAVAILLHLHPEGNRGHVMFLGNAFGHPEHHEGVGECWDVDLGHYKYFEGVVKLSN